MRDEEFRFQTDYSTGQTQAAHRILLEITNILNEYRDELLIIGGWVPDLLFPGQNHIGSIDVDVLLNHSELQEASYLTIKRLLIKNGYKEHPEKFFSFMKTVVIDGEEFSVDLDLLAGMYGGTIDNRSKTS